jgi:hypothetical protein
MELKRSEFQITTELVLRVARFEEVVFLVGFGDVHLNCLPQVRNLDIFQVFVLAIKFSAIAHLVGCGVSFGSEIYGTLTVSMTLSSFFFD